MKTAFCTIIILQLLMLFGCANTSPVISIEKSGNIIYSEFDLPTLRKFLIDVIQQQKKFEDTDLIHTKISDSWSDHGGDVFSLCCGDWFVLYNPTQPSTFSFIYDYAPNKYVILWCTRKNKDSFEFTGASKGESVSIIVARERAGPNPSPRITMVHP
jgi:hypothetical protein